MHHSAAGPRHAWAAAITGSLGFHLLVFWVLSGLEQNDPLPRRTPDRLDVYLFRPRVPENPEPSAEGGGPPNGEAITRLPRLLPNQPIQTQAPALDRDVASNSGATSSESMIRPAPRIDWSADIASTVARLRDEATRYRDFGYPDAKDDDTDTENDPTRRLSDVTRGETEVMSWGERRMMINQSCYQSGYDSGTVLGEVHRFSNSFVTCLGSRPAKPRDDLFEDAKPAYLR